MLIHKESRISNILKSFGIRVSSISIEEEKNFDIYNIRLKDGSRYIKIEKALQDIGIQLKSYSVPIGRPITRDGVYRLSVQKNPIKSSCFTDLYESSRSIISEDSYCPVMLGVDSRNYPFVIDMNKLPNLLVGGIPGSGKSMLLHSIVLSAIKNDSLIFLSDPKMVEFSMYRGQPNIGSISYSPKEHVDIINKVIDIMDSRFRLLRKSNSRDVLEYNSSNKRKLRPISLVIDEWADIVLYDKKVQEPLCRLAQKGRAAGISIILATQRPSSSVISGLIKASFSGRVALRTSSYVDSRVILDESGAEKIVDVGVGIYKDHRNINPIMFRTPIINDLKKLVEKRSRKSIFSI